MLIDTHGHLNFNAFKEDSKDLIKDILDKDMALIMPGSQLSTSKRAVKLAGEINSPNLWAAVGLHPIHLEERSIDKDENGNVNEYETFCEEYKEENYLSLAKNDKTVAIGEIGLDYWNRPKNKQESLKYAEKQHDVFEAQLNLALKAEKPVILHCRVAHKDMLKVLEGHAISESLKIPGVVHSYTGSAKQLKRFLNMGYYIGVNGLVFTLGLVRDAVQAAPLDRIVLETDSPYLTPPQAEDERNTPLNLKYIAQEIAKIKKVTPQVVEKQTTTNAKLVFGI